MPHVQVAPPKQVKHGAMMDPMLAANMYAWAEAWYNLGHKYLNVSRPAVFDCYRCWKDAEAQWDGFPEALDSLASSHFEKTQVRLYLSDEEIALASKS